MRSKLFTLISLTAISISFIFGGCGGGGGGGDGGGGASGIQYTGLTTQATIDESNAEDIAVGAYMGGDIGTVMGLSSHAQTGAREFDRSRTITVSEAIEKFILNIDLTASFDGPSIKAIIADSDTIYGNCGGSASFTFKINDVTGEFTGNFNFNNYCEDGVTITGRSNVSGEVDLDFGDIRQFSMSFDSLTFTVADDSFTIKGSITYDDLEAPIVNVEMDLLMSDSITEKVFWAQNYYLRISKGPDYIDVYIIGRYYDPEYGYVDVESTTDFRIYDGEDWPSKGVLIVEGDTGSFGGNTISCLTVYTCGACVVDADTDGGGSYNWSSGFSNMLFDETDPPEAPYNFEPPNNETIVGAEPTFSWTAGARSCGFDVYLDTVNPPLTIVSSKQSETTFQPSGLVASTIYYWRVVAWNAIGSESSDVLSFKTGEVNLSAIIGRGVWSAGNSHEYVVVSSPAKIWDNAVTDLNTLIPGYHLATITSQEENDFVSNLMTSLDAHGQYWLGGIQDPDELIDDKGWTWVTSEPWDYTNWEDGEPNGGILENHLAMYGYVEWNDEGSAIGSIDGYIAESSAAVE
jgi:hypothetical protein